jgi:hypothetical protein
MSGADLSVGFAGENEKKIKNRKKKIYVSQGIVL